MKTTRYITALLTAAALGLAACSDDEVRMEQEGESGGDATVTFTCCAPLLSTASRAAYSDGTTADNLYYAVYADINGERTLTETNVAGTSVSADKPLHFSEESQPKANVNLHLAMGQTYTVIFWGMADDAPYAFDPSEGTVTVDYEDALCNDESRDAFYATETFKAERNAATRNVTLTRPFAQLNVGVEESEWQRAVQTVATPTKSAMTVNRAYRRLNLFDGSVSDPAEVEFHLASLPDGQTFPKREADNTDYHYMAMNYVLVNAKENFDVTFFTDEMLLISDYWDVPNVPMERNHRTNIYGGSLVASTLTHTFTVEIDPIYDTPANDEMVLDGVAYPAVPSTNYKYGGVKEFLNWIYNAEEGVDFILTENIEVDDSSIQKSIGSWGGSTSGYTTLSANNATIYLNGYSLKIYNYDTYCARYTYRNMLVSGNIIIQGPGMVYGALYSWNSYKFCMLYLYSSGSLTVNDAEVVAYTTYGNLHTYDCGYSIYSPAGQKVVLKDCVVRNKFGAATEGSFSLEGGLYVADPLTWDSGAYDASTTEAVELTSDEYDAAYRQFLSKGTIHYTPYTRGSETYYQVRAK